MKITDIKTYAFLYHRKDAMMDSFCMTSQRGFLLVAVETDCGIVGYGEASSYGGSLPACRALIENELRPQLIGEDPLLRERLWLKMFKKSYQHGRGGVAVGALGGIDIALWDIAGKAAGLPVYKLLGGFDSKVKVYASCGFYKEGKGLEQLAREMEQQVEKGFKAVKMKIGRLPRISASALRVMPGGDKCCVTFEEDMERVQAVRKAVGPDIDVLVDANNSWDLAYARRYAAELEKLNIYLLEEPMPTEDVEGHVTLNRLTSIPVAGFETAYTIYEFKRFIDRRAVDIVQPDAVWSGGITECRKIADYANANHVKAVFHSFSSAYCLAANLHLAAAVPNADMVEFDVTDNPLRSDILTCPFTVNQDGYVELSDKPGLGIDIDWSKAEKYLVE
ncbi:MAG: mandelate racemase/muconate lactonizing enzyme family protein [Oscillospiraceae bacterium]